MANNERRNAPEMRRRPKKIGKARQFTVEELDKALQDKRSEDRAGLAGGKPFGKASDSPLIEPRTPSQPVEVHAGAVVHEPADADDLYPQCLLALQDGLHSDNWRERFECSKLLLAYFWGRPTQQVVSDKQVRVMFDSPALQHLNGRDSD